MPELTSFAIAQLKLDQAVERLGLDAATHEFLRRPQKELVVTIPLQMDDGGIRSSAATGSSTTAPAVRTRAGSAGTRTRRSTRSGHRPPG